MDEIVISPKRDQPSSIRVPMLSLPLIIRKIFKNGTTEPAQNGAQNNQVQPAVADIPIPPGIRTIWGDIDALWQRDNQEAETIALENMSTAATRESEPDLAEVAILPNRAQSSTVKTPKFSLPLIFKKMFKNETIPSAQNGAQNNQVLPAVVHMPIPPGIRTISGDIDAIWQSDNQEAQTIYLENLSDAATRESEPDLDEVVISPKRNQPSSIKDPTFPIPLILRNSDRSYEEEKDGIETIVLGNFKKHSRRDPNPSPIMYENTWI